MTSPSPSRSANLPVAVLDFVHDLCLDDVPDEVVAFAQRCLLDLVGVAAAGRATELSRIIHDHAVANFGPGRDQAGQELAAPIAFDGRRVSPAGAALAMGMTIDAVDAHDGHNLTKGHSGCHQLPALLAFTQAESADDPRSFLASLIVGYEIATRAGIALHATAPDYHTSGAWGAVGAAALGARTLGLDHQQTFEAMGVAEYHGPRSQMMRVIDHPTMLKDGSGWGAMAGVSAAYLARNGFTGAPAITVNSSDVAAIWADLGEHWIIMDQYFKPLPICRWAQPAVEAALHLRRSHNISGHDIVAVTVETFHEAVRLATAHPSTTEQAQYSLPFPVAAALMRGTIGADEITADGLNDPDIARLADQVRLVENSDHNEVFPARRLARVTIELTSGKTVASLDTEPVGDADNPLPMSAIRSKFHELASPVVGPDRAAAIELAVDELTTKGSLADLFAVIEAGPLD